MASFIGTYTNKVDAKGRISVPARYRTAIGNQSFQGIVVSPSVDSGALDACDYDRIEGVVAGLDTPGLYTEAQRIDAERALGNAVELPFDAEGRVVLPERFLALGGIEREALFVGIGRVFQIWSPGRRAAFDQEVMRGGDGASMSLKNLPNPAAALARRER